MFYKFNEPVTCDKMRFIFKNKGKLTLTIGVVKLFLDPADLEALKAEFKKPTMEELMGGCSRKAVDVAGVVGEWMDGLVAVSKS